MKLKTYIHDLLLQLDPETELNIEDCEAVYDIIRDLNADGDDTNYDKVQVIVKVRNYLGLSIFE